MAVLETLVDAGTSLIGALFGSSPPAVDPVTGEPLEGGGRFGSGAYCPIVGTPQTEAEVRAALNRTPGSRLQQLYELIAGCNAHQGLTGDYRIDLYDRIREWPRWAMGGDNCYIDNPSCEPMKRDFLEWWDVYGSGGLDTPPPPDGSPGVLEELGRAVLGLFSGGGGSLPPGSEPRILGVRPGTLVLLVLAIAGVYLWTRRG